MIAANDSRMERSGESNYEAFVCRRMFQDDKALGRCHDLNGVVYKFNSRPHKSIF